MRILVYGAGVIGCELAHMLHRAGNDVILLARGEWKSSIDKNGLIIRHYVQLHTTVDRLSTIEALESDDVYDIIFVVMQYGQVNNVLPIIAKNQSRYIVLVGNNMGADTSAQIISTSTTEKELAFGFQATGGRRENGKVISVHASVGMTIGGLHAPLTESFCDHLKKAFASVKYRLTWEENMDAWLKCHMAFILPIAYLCYATDFKLSKATKHQRHTAIAAALEGYAVLRKLGYPIRPANSETALTVNQKSIRALLWVISKTPIGRLAASDHCKNAGAEMVALDAAFEQLRRQSGMPTPNWEALCGEGQPHL